MIVQGQKLALLSRPEMRLNLYPHQAVMLDEWGRHKTSVSHLMTLKDHIFVIVPKIVEDELDWRLPVFECGRNLIAFDWELKV